MGMFGMFGGKKTNGAEIGEWRADMAGMMKMLAGMPNMMRKPMMKGRINQIPGAAGREAPGIHQRDVWSVSQQQVE